MLLVFRINESGVLTITSDKIHLNKIRTSISKNGIHEDAIL